jgi:hypothetical protein
MFDHLGPIFKNLKHVILSAKDESWVRELVCPNCRKVMRETDIKGFTNCESCNVIYITDYFKPQ